MSKINKLTKDQEAELVKFREQYRKIGTSCRSMTQQEKLSVQRVIADFYKRIEMDNPLIFFCQSPWQANMEINISMSNYLGANLWDNLGAILRENLGDNLWAMGANLQDNLGAMGANLQDNLRANLETNLRANLLANLRANLRENLRANLRDNLRDNLWANL